MSEEKHTQWRREAVNERDVQIICRQEKNEDDEKEDELSLPAN